MSKPLITRRMQKHELESLKKDKSIAIYKSTYLGFDPFSRIHEYIVEYIRRGGDTSS